MLKLIFVIIILFVAIRHLMEEEPKKGIKEPVAKTVPEAVVAESVLTSTSGTKIEKPVIVNNLPSVIKDARPQEVMVTKEGFSNDGLMETTVWTFNSPRPWTKVKRVPGEEYPYHFHIKAKIPALNDFENWKQIVPNIDFDPQGGEIVIPSRDEGSALALANLMVSNFYGLLSLEEILSKNLIQISVSKAQISQAVQNKLREQIIDTLFGSNTTMPKSSLNTDLAQNGGGKTNGSIEAYDGTEYAYL